MGRAGVPLDPLFPPSQVPGGMGPEGKDNATVLLILKYVSSCLAALKEKAASVPQDRHVPCPSAATANAVEPFTPSPVMALAVPSDSSAHQAQL